MLNASTEFPPEYVNASNAGRIVGVIGVFHFIALIFVILRVYVRLAIVRTFGVDDGLIIVTVALALGSWICLVLQIPYGLGRHGLVVPVDDRIRFEHITFWKTVISDGVAMGLLRISMALSLLSLNRDLKWYRWSLYAVIAFVIAYSIQAIAWLFVYCTPYSGWWEFQWMNPFDPRCHSFTTFVNLVYWNICQFPLRIPFGARKQFHVVNMFTACNIFTDVCLGALPVPIIWNLKMSLRLRLYVIGILNLGYFAVLMGILKAVYMLTTGGDPDAIFNYWVHFWQNLQLNIGIIVACASFLRRLVGRFLKINSSAERYASDYNRSGRTPAGTTGSKAYHSSRRRTGILDDTLHDEFELHTKSDLRAVDQESSSVAPSAKTSHSEVVSNSRASPDVMHNDGPTADSNSEEIILQGAERANGIVYTREFTVKYDSK
ncbi:hypothetical protein HJFPF1_09699 [Paramyrothecium foliicola]|nr:hypothetical protein HJFPF1_09699 [Paramyrothecium foliicola]